MKVQSKKSVRNGFLEEGEFELSLAEMIRFGQNPKVL